MGHVRNWKLVSKLSKNPSANKNRHIGTPPLVPITTRPGRNGSNAPRPIPVNGQSSRSSSSHSKESQPPSQRQQPSTRGKTEDNPTNDSDLYSQFQHEVEHGNDLECRLGLSRFRPASLPPHTLTHTHSNERIYPRVHIQYLNVLQPELLSGSVCDGGEDSVVGQLVRHDTHTLVQHTHDGLMHQTRRSHTHKHTHLPGTESGSCGDTSLHRPIQPLQPHTYASSLSAMCRCECCAHTFIEDESSATPTHTHVHMHTQHNDNNDNNHNNSDDDEDDDHPSLCSTHVPMWATLTFPYSTASLTVDLSYNEAALRAVSGQTDQYAAAAVMAHQTHVLTGDGDHTHTHTHTHPYPDAVSEMHMHIDTRRPVQSSPSQRTHTHTHIPPSLSLSQSQSLSPLAHVASAYTDLRFAVACYYTSFSDQQQQHTHTPTWTSPLSQLGDLSPVYTPFGMTTHTHVRELARFTKDGSRFWWDADAQTHTHIHTHRVSRGWPQSQRQKRGINDYRQNTQTYESNETEGCDNYDYGDTHTAATELRKH